MAQLVERLPSMRIPPEATRLFLLRKKELSSGVAALLCLVSLTELTHIQVLYVLYLHVHNVQYMYTAAPYLVSV